MTGMTLSLEWAWFEGAVNLFGDSACTGNPFV